MGWVPFPSFDRLRIVDDEIFSPYNDTRLSALLYHFTQQILPAIEPHSTNSLTATEFKDDMTDMDMDALRQSHADTELFAYVNQNNGAVDELLSVWNKEDGNALPVPRLQLMFDRACNAENVLTDITRVLLQDKVEDLDIVFGSAVVQSDQASVDQLERSIAESCRLCKIRFLIGFNRTYPHAFDQSSLHAVCRGLTRNTTIKDLTLVVKDQDQAATVIQYLPQINSLSSLLLYVPCWRADEGNVQEYDGRSYRQILLGIGFKKNTSLLSFGLRFWDDDSWGFKEDEILTAMAGETLKRNLLLSKIPPRASSTTLPPGVLPLYLAKMATDHQAFATPAYEMLRTFYVPFLQPKDPSEGTNTLRKRKRVE